MRLLLMLAYVVFAPAGAFVQQQAPLDAIAGRWMLDRAASARVNLPATELVITPGASQVTIRRHWANDAGTGDGFVSTDVIALDGRESPLSDGRTGAATVDGAVLTLTLTLTRTRTATGNSPAQVPGEYRTITREVYRAAGNTLSIERTIYGVRPGEATGQGPVATLVYRRTNR